MSRLFVRSVALRCPLRCALPVVRRLPVVRCARENKLFLTRLLTSEDEYKWYWHQMIYFPETINTVSTLNTITLTRSLVLSQLCTPLTLCMLASWSHEGAVFLDFLSSSHPITSSLFPYLGSTHAPCSRPGVLIPPSPKWRPHPQGPRTLPYQDPEQLYKMFICN